MNYTALPSYSFEHSSFEDAFAKPHLSGLDKTSLAVDFNPDVTTLSTNDQKASIMAESTF